MAHGAHRRRTFEPQRPMSAFLGRMNETRREETSPAGPGRRARAGVSHGTSDSRLNDLAVHDEDARTCDAQRRIRGRTKAEKRPLRRNENGSSLGPSLLKSRKPRLPKGGTPRVRDAPRFRDAYDVRLALLGLRDRGGDRGRRRRVGCLLRCRSRRFRARCVERRNASRRGIRLGGVRARPLGDVLGRFRERRRRDFRGRRVPERARGRRPRVPRGEGAESPGSVRHERRPVGTRGEAPGRSLRDAECSAARVVIRRGARAHRGGFRV